MSSPHPSDCFFILFLFGWFFLGGMEVSDERKRKKIKAKLWLWSGGKQRGKIEEAVKWGKTPNNDEKPSKNTPQNQHKYNKNSYNNNENDDTTTSSTTNNK